MAGYSGDGWVKNKIQHKKNAWEALKKGDAMEAAKEGGSYNTWEKNLGANNDKQKKKIKESERLHAEQMEASRGVLDRMNSNQSDYLKQIDSLETQASDQAHNASKVYNNDIQPRMKSVMEDAQRQAKNAMSLGAAGDVNNDIHKAVRKLYDDQAQGVRKQSLADVGVLNALGSQATSQQMGGSGAPLTGSQLQLLSANNNQQSGLAYARAQQQMQSLREQGLNRGFEASDAQYNRGQAAKDRYNSSIGNYETSMDRNIDRQRGFRGELGGFNNQRYGTQQGGEARELGYQQNLYGGKQEDLNRQIAIANSDNAARSAIASSFVGSGGAMVGGWLGGAQGAKTGRETTSSHTDAAGKGGQVPQQNQQQGQQQSYNQVDYYGNGQDPYGQRQNPYAQPQQQQQQPQRYYA